MKRSYQLILRTGHSTTGIQFCCSVLVSQSDPVIQFGECRSLHQTQRKEGVVLPLAPPPPILRGSQNLVWKGKKVQNNDFGRKRFSPFPSKMSSESVPFSLLLGHSPGPFYLPQRRLSENTNLVLSHPCLKFFNGSLRHDWTRSKASSRTIHGPANSGRGSLSSFSSCLPSAPALQRVSGFAFILLSLHTLTSA